MKKYEEMHANELLSLSIEDARRHFFIHQTWAQPGEQNYSLPAKNFVDSWKSNRNGATHVLWNDADNKNLVEKFYPEYNCMIRYHCSYTV